MELYKLGLVLLLWICWGQVDVSGDDQDGSMDSITSFLRRIDIQEKWPPKTTTSGEPTTTEPNETTNKTTDTATTKTTMATVKSTT